MGKTIKQIADELGVSKQAVQKRLSREPLYTTVAPYISTIDGVKYIAVVGENLVKSAFSKSSVDKTSDLSIDKSENLSIDKTDLYTPIIEVLQATIDTLQGQLVAKDEQIRTLQEQLSAKDVQIGQITAAMESTAAALTAAQALHAADKKTLMLIEDKESERKLSFWKRRAAKKAEKKARKEQSDE